MSKFMNFHLLQNSFSCPVTAHLRRWSIRKIKIKNLLSLSCYKTLFILFFSFSSTFQCLSCISCHVKNFYYFLDGSNLLGDFFTFLRRTRHNTSISHYRQLQVPIMIFNKEVLWIFLVSPTQRTHIMNPFEICIGNCCYWMSQKQCAQFFLVLLYFELLVKL